MLSKIEQQHYHRQLILTEIGEIGQSKLKKQLFWLLEQVDLDPPYYRT